jgi:Primase C terminal 1 (PriCT-1)
MWRYEGRNGRTTKVPYRVDGYRASSTNSDDWSDYTIVVRTLENRPQEFDGIGFVFSKDDPYVGADLDNCLERGEVKPWARPIIEKLSDTYMEISPSGKGIKIFAEAKLPGRGKRKPYGYGAIEIYDRDRFFAVTGRAFNRAPLQIEDHQADIESLYRSLERTPKNGDENVSLQKEGKIRKGHRHDSLVSLAGTMRRHGMSVDEIDAALQVANSTRCEPPYDRQHVRKIADSAGQWEPGPTNGAAHGQETQERSKAADEQETEGLPKPEFNEKGRLIAIVPTIGNTLLHLDRFAKNEGEKLHVFRDGVYRDNGREVIRKTGQQLMEHWGAAGQWKKGIADEVY